jgi:hypothetical protein
MHRLGELLVIEHVLTPEARDAALVRMAITGERIGSAAIDGGANADRVAMVLARQRGVLAARDHQLSAIAPALRALLPEDDARRMCAVPLRLAAGTGELIVAVRDPGDPEVLADLALITGKTVRLAVAAERRLRQAIDVLYGRAAADNPLLSRAPVVTRPPAEAARMLAEMSTASAGGWRAGRRWRRLLELALVVGLVASLIGMYARQGRRAERKARALPTVGSGSGDPPGRLEHALGGYDARLASCRKDFEVCLSECRRTTPMGREARCDDWCDKTACAKLRVRASELGPSQNAPSR